MIFNSSGVGKNERTIGFYFSILVGVKLLGVSRGKYLWTEADA
jgi:hypothetical protein